MDIGYGLSMWPGNGAVAAGPSALGLKVTSGWKLEEAAGATRNDVITPGGMNLNDNGTVGQVAGIQGNGASFSRASSQFLSHADSAILQLGGGSLGFSISLWLNMTSWANSTYYSLVTKMNWPADKEFEIAIRPDTSQIDVIVGWADNSGGVESTASWAGNASLPAGWHHFVLTMDTANSLQKVYHNGTQFISAANTHGCRAGANAFTIGGTSLLGGTMNGAIDEVYLFKNYVLTPTDVATLYNGGAGVTYPF